MRLLAKYRDPEQLTGILKLEGGTEWWEYPRRPNVIDVTVRALREWRPAARQLPYLGYRLVEHEQVYRVSRYVRPLPLWLCHRVGVAAHRFYHQSVGWLYDHGLIGLACDEGVMFRLRDIRPWPFGRSSHGD